MANALLIRLAESVWYNKKNGRNRPFFIACRISFVWVSMMISAGWLENMVGS
jgi:hypothetical protein